MGKRLNRVVGVTLILGTAACLWRQKWLVFSLNNWDFPKSRHQKVLNSKQLEIIPGKFLDLKAKSMLMAMMEESKVCIEEVNVVVGSSSLVKIKQ